jgi:PAS domain S-box-containing protein
MLSHWAVAGASLAYVGSLFAVAYWVERQGERGGIRLANPYVYSLSLGAYATAWSFYGSTGLAAVGGVAFLPIHLGAFLAVLLWPVVMGRMVRAVRRYHVTSIADLVASRYGKSALVGGTFALVAMVGLVPYLALQLKAISSTFTLLTGGMGGAASEPLPVLSDTAFYAVILQAAFAMLFGARRLSPNERHDGLVAAIAFESLVKLAALLCMGVFVTFFLHDGIADLFGQAAARLPQYERLISIGPGNLPDSRWLSFMLLAMLSVTLLPSQFHLAAVENRDEEHLYHAVWLFPLYLLSINLCILPIAFAGLLFFPAGTVHPDNFVLALPMAFGPAWLTLLVFLGGLSAATAHVVVSTLALSIMACNNLILPILLRMGWIRALPAEHGGRLVLGLRRLAILVLLALAYGYLRLAGSAYALVEIGLVSFVAVAQFAPVVLGGLFWRQGSRLGVLAGLLLGFAVWSYTLLLPAFASSGWLPAHLVNDGPFDQAWLKPLTLFGLEGLDRVSHGLFWSLLANTLGYVGMSLARPARAEEEQAAARFVDVLEEDLAVEAAQPDRLAAAEDLHGLLERFLGSDYANEAMVWYARERDVADWRTLEPDPDLVERVEYMLAGAVGAPSARILVDSVLKQAPVSRQAILEIAEETSLAIAYSHRLEEQSRKLEALAAALGESEGRLDAIIDNAPAAIFMKDPAGHYLLINRLFEESFRVSRDAVKGRTDHDIFPAEFADAFVRDDRQVLATNGPVQIEEMAPGPDGMHTYLTVKFPLRDARGQVYAVCGIATDITERKRTEEAVAEARARFFGILDIAADAIISVDGGQRITLFNKGAEEIFGYAAGEALGQPLGMLLPERLRAAHRQHLEGFMGSPNTTRRMGERLNIVGRRKDGSEFPAAASISNLQVGGERVLTVTLRDMTEARAAEAAIRDLNRDLEVRAQQLETVNKELEAFSYSVSHDLRAPLRGISGFSRLLEEGCADRLDDQGRLYLTRIQETCQRMAQLIEDMLFLAVVTRGEMTREEVDLSALARAIAQELQAGQPDREAEFLIQDGVHAKGDPRLLRVLLDNLLGNAWKYSGKRPRSHIEFGSTEQPDGTRVCFVRDNGAGFDMQYAERLFKAFQRLHSSGEFPGTGIGLATVQRIVNRHGGKVWAEGAVGRGATFYFSLS